MKGRLGIEWGVLRGRRDDRRVLVFLEETKAKFDI